MGVLLGPHPVRPLPADRLSEPLDVDPVGARLTHPIADRPTAGRPKLARLRPTDHLVVQVVGPHLGLVVDRRRGPGGQEVVHRVRGVSGGNHDASPAMSWRALPCWRRMAIVASWACRWTSCMICAWLR